MKRGNTTSKVAERIAFLQGQRVKLHVDPDVHGEGSRIVEGTYEDVHCMGREYFFVVKVDDDRERVLVRTTDVSLLEQLKGT